MTHSICFLFFLAITILVAVLSSCNCKKMKSQSLDDGHSTTEEGNEAGRSRVSQITDAEIERVFETCNKRVDQRNELENKLLKKGRIVTTRRADPSLIRRKSTDPAVHAREFAHLPFEEATEEFYQRYKFTPEEIDGDLRRCPLNGAVSRNTRHSCVSNTTFEANCNRNARYRTANGQCNNLNNPDWGMAMACQQRMMEASYIGNSGYRVSVSGDPLPTPRTLSLNLHYHLNRPTNYVTHMYMFFGQLLDHDIALTPFSSTVDNEAIECCPPEEETHPQCSPIIIRQNDPFYSQFGITCLNFVRSSICPTCAMGTRQQIDQVTSFIDASFVYGNSDNETSSLRTNDGTGRLRIQNSNNGDLLPRSEDPQNDLCSFPQTNDICFMAGDPRANQHTVLASLHTIFMREHNRLADGLRRENPQWNGETLFQEARRILGAEMQAITYKEYLPVTLGNDRMQYFDLCLSNDRGTTVYDSQKNPTMINEFSTAAFRFGHSLINSVVTDRPTNSSNGVRLLRNEFFQPFDLYNGVIGPLVSGASNSAAQWFDQHLVQDVTNFLYRVRGNQTGLDLASFNINRGRDHGVQPYVNAVRFCSEGEIVVRNFDDLVRNNLMRREQADALRRNYRNVGDVDLWPGILMEIPNDGAVVGPTGACFIGLMFNKLKFGDRYYFEHRNQVGSFTYRQIQEIRKTTLSKIICLNTDVSQIALNAMIFNSRNNPMINCRYVSGVNLAYWRQ